MKLDRQKKMVGQGFSTNRANASLFGGTSFKAKLTAPGELFVNKASSF